MVFFNPEEFSEFENKLFDYFSFDKAFVAYKIERKMQAVERHYRYSLIHARNCDERAYRAMLPVIVRWLQDAYLDFGLRLGHQGLVLSRVEEEQWDASKQQWRKHGLRAMAKLDNPRGKPLLGRFYFYYYYIEIVESNEETLLQHGVMPWSLQYLLYHYLRHAHFETLTPLVFPASEEV